MAVVPLCPTGCAKRWMRQPWVLQRVQRSPPHGVASVWSRRRATWKGGVTVPACWQRWVPMLVATPCAAVLPRLPPCRQPRARHTRQRHSFSRQACCQAPRVAGRPPSLLRWQARCPLYPVPCLACGLTFASLPCWQPHWRTASAGAPPTPPAYAPRLQPSSGATVLWQQLEASLAGSSTHPRAPCWRRWMPWLLARRTPLVPWRSTTCRQATPHCRWRCAMQGSYPSRRLPRLGWQCPPTCRRARHPLPARPPTATLDGRMSPQQQVLPRAALMSRR